MESARVDIMSQTRCKIIVTKTVTKNLSDELKVVLPSRALDIDVRRRRGVLALRTISMFANAQHAATFAQAVAWYIRRCRTVEQTCKFVSAVVIFARSVMTVKPWGLGNAVGQSYEVRRAVCAAKQRYERERCAHTAGSRRKAGGSNVRVEPNDPGRTTVDLAHRVRELRKVADIQTVAEYDDERFV